jgi:hypothetical protein
MLIVIGFPQLKIYGIFSSYFTTTIYKMFAELSYFSDMEVARYGCTVGQLKINFIDGQEGFFYF